MNIRVRNSLFETNSSSVHTIAIERKTPTYFPKEIYFRVGEFGWGRDVVEPADYLYTAILYMYGYEISNDDNSEDYKAITQNRLDRIKEVLVRKGIKPVFLKPEDGESYYIDHVNELNEFIDMILEDENMLIRFLVGPDSYVETGNDNEFECEVIKHDEEKFEYFEKGN